MKKYLVALLALLLAFSLCACAKSEAVTNVETLIGNLGSVHLEDSEKVAEAREAYDALSEEEAAMVSNAADLVIAEERLMELMITGDWRYVPETFSDIRNMYNVVNMSLRPDMTVTGDQISGTWYVDDGQLCIDNGETIVLYDICINEDNGNLELAVEEVVQMIRTEDMNALLDDMFIFVDLTKENIDIYCDVASITEQEVDTFGTPTGDYVTRIGLSSKAISNGLRYFGNEDVAVELLIPKHEYTKSKGSKNFKYTEEAGSYNLTGCIFDGSGYEQEFFDEDGMKNTHKVSADDVSFGRVKGTMIFINSDYVVATKESAGLRYLILVGGQEICVGEWRDGLDY